MSVKPKRASKARPKPEDTAPLAGALTAIETILSPNGEPVLGLYAHALHLVLMRTLSEDPAYAAILPHLIGAPAMLLARPGLSQTELARLLGKERATIGLQIEQCLAKGLVRRIAASDDRRKYQLFITAKGREFLAAARRAVPDHEARFARGLTAAERATLRRLLWKMITG
jgi:DNA-binding MarR family transcriptional regulator